MKRNETPPASWMFTRDTVEDWAWANVFTDEECDKIIEYGNTFNLYTGDTMENTGVYRKSDVVFLQPEEQYNWIWQKVSDASLYLNSRFFNFDLYGFTEGFQFTRYESPGGKYDSHIDKIPSRVRKLSIVVQLSPEEEYEGGEFNLNIDSVPLVLPKTRGTMIAFPSYSLHSVTPMIRGTRYSLVGWVSGPPFK